METEGETLRGENGRSGEGRLEAEGIGFAFHVVELTQDILVRLKKLVKDGQVNVVVRQR